MKMKAEMGFLAGVMMGIAVSCFQAPPAPNPQALEERLVLPSQQQRKNLMQSAVMIRHTVKYSVVQEMLNPLTKKWEKEEESEYVAEGHGSGVAIAHVNTSTYVLSAKHVLNPADQEYRQQHEFLPLRRTFTKKSEEFGLVTAYKHNAENKLEYITLPLETVATSDKDLAVLRTHERTSVQLVNKLGDVCEGQMIFGVGFRTFTAIDNLYMKLNERLIRSFDVGFVKSIGDPTDPSDDHIAYVLMSTQEGVSGGPVFNAKGDLVGLRAHVFLTKSGNTEDMINAGAIRSFLCESGHGHLCK